MNFFTAHTNPCKSIDFRLNQKLRKSTLYALIIVVLASFNLTGSNFALAADTVEWDTDNDSGGAILYDSNRDLILSEDQFVIFKSDDSTYPTITAMEVVDAEGSHSIRKNLTKNEATGGFTGEETPWDDGDNLDHWRSDANDTLASWYITKETTECDTNKHCVYARLVPNVSQFAGITQEGKIARASLTIGSVTITGEIYRNQNTPASFAWSRGVETTDLNSDGIPEFSLDPTPLKLIRPGLEATLTLPTTSTNGAADFSAFAFTLLHVTDSNDSGFLGTEDEPIDRNLRNTDFKVYDSTELPARSWLVANDFSKVEYYYDNNLGDNLLWGGRFVTTLSIGVEATFDSRTQIVDVLSLSIIYTKPKLDISITSDISAAGSVNEGAEATFTVQSDKLPADNLMNNPYNIRYRVEFTPASENLDGYNYIDPEVLGTGITICDQDTAPNTRCGDFMFTRIRSQTSDGSFSTDYRTTITIKTKVSDNLDSGGGTITVTLVESSRTKPKTDSATATSLISDTFDASVPRSIIVSIEALSTNSIDEGETAMFRLISNNAPDNLPFSIRYKVSSTSSLGYAYMLETQERKENVFLSQDFSFIPLPNDQDGRFYSELNIPTKLVDNIAHSDGRILVTLDETANQVPGVSVIGATASININDLGANAANDRRTYSIAALSPLVVEGRPAKFQITSSLDPGPDFTISYSQVFEANPANTGSHNYLRDTSEEERQFTAVSLTFSRVGSTDDYSAEFDVATNPRDSTNNGGGKVVVTLSFTFNGKISDTGRMAEVAIADSLSLDAQPLVNFETLNSPLMDEGVRRTIVLTAEPAPLESIFVLISVSQTGDFVTFAPSKAVIEADQSSANLFVHTNDDLVDEENGSITLTIVSDLTSPYRVGLNNTSRIEVADNDEPGETGSRLSVAGLALQEILENSTESESGEPDAARGEGGVPLVSIASSQGQIEEGQTVTFQLTASFATADAIVVHVNLTESGKLVEGELNRRVRLAPHRRMTELSVVTMNDEIPETDGELTATIVSGEGYATATQDRVSVRVSDRTDREVHGRRVAEAYSAITPEILSLVGENGLDTVGDRFELAFSGANQTSLNLGGRSTVQDLIVMGGTDLNNDGLTDLKSRLANSSISVNLFPEEGAQGPATAWGINTTGSVTGSDSASNETWAGDLSVGQFGFDTRIGNEFLLGTSASVLEVDVDYDGRDGNNLIYESRFVGIHPYLGYNAMDGNTELLVAAGYGVGELGINHPEQVPAMADSSYQMASIAGRRRVNSGTSPIGGDYRLDLNGEAFMARQVAADEVSTGSIIDASVSQMQLTTEVGNRQTLDIGKLEPSLSIGLQRDTVHGRSAIGTLLTSEVTFTNYEGLLLSGFGSMVLNDGSEPEQLQFSSRIAYDQNSDGTGYRVRMSSKWQDGSSSGKFSLGNGGSTFGGTLFANTNQSGGLHMLEIGHGFAVLDGTSLLTPEVAMEFASTRVEEYKIGNQFDYEQDLQIELAASRNLRGNGDNDRKLRLGGNVQW